MRSADSKSLAEYALTFIPEAQARFAQAQAKRKADAAARDLNNAAEWLRRRDCSVEAGQKAVHTANRENWKSPSRSRPRQSRNSLTQWRPSRPQMPRSPRLSNNNKKREKTNDQLQPRLTVRPQVLDRISSDLPDRKRRAFFRSACTRRGEQAERELALVNAPTRPGGWKIADLNCIGFGIIDGVVSRNELSTAMTDTEWRKIGKEVDETLWTAWQRDA